MQATAVPTQKIDPALIAPFLRSVVEVLRTMAGLATTVGVPTIKTTQSAGQDCSGIIGFSGQVTGSMVLSFHDDVASKILSAFAGTPLNPGDPDFVDALGELANVIAGNAKKDLGVDASITVPSVITGAGHAIARLSGVPCVAFPCTNAAGTFVIEVSIRRNVR